MTTHLYLAPASAGKTAHVIARAIAAARELQPVWVILPSARQRRAFGRRLIQQGGALGVQVTTFSQLYGRLLTEGGQPVSQLHDAVRLCLLRATLDDLAAEGALPYYAGLVAKPGFAAALGQMFREFKQGMIRPRDLADTWRGYDAGPRLEELTAIYAAYQARLQENGWSDDEGMGWLALRALQDTPALASDWRLCLVDGFDSLNTLQVEILRCLQGRAQELVITLTGDHDRERSMAQAVFLRTRERLQRALAVEAEPLPSVAAGDLHPALCELDAIMFEPTTEQVACPAPSPLAMIEAPDRAGEAREALRWCKARIVEDKMAPGEVALLARNLEPYRPFLLDMAQEMGLPVSLAGGIPLNENPAVGALLDLMGLMLPLPDSTDALSFPRRGVIEAWRCPYFDWANALAQDGEPLPITSEDVRALDELTRQGLVIQGLEQWRESFDAILLRDTEIEDADGEAHGADTASERVKALELRFDAFVARLCPPTRASLSAYVAWLEALIGRDVARNENDADDDDSLNLLRRLNEDANRGDRPAMRALVSALRGLVWAEERLGVGQDVSYTRFFDELHGAIKAAGYRLDEEALGEGLLLASLHEARGVSFRAVAIMGMAEGEFPQLAREDPLLRDVDREYLQRQGLQIDTKVRSDEGTLFYEAITRGRERLLLSRPRLAESGAEWQASPYWDEVLRRTGTNPRRGGGDDLSWEQVASAQELMIWAFARTHRDQALREEALTVWQRVHDGQAVLTTRSRRGGDAHDGDLSAVRDDLARRFGPSMTWSASALQTYIGCPLQFFCSRVLGLDARAEPTEGVDAAQRGSILHAIMEQLYREHAEARVDELLEALPTVAASVLREAAPPLWLSRDRLVARDAA